MHVVLYAQFLMIYFSQGLIHIKGVAPFLICATVEKTSRGRRAKSETCWAVP
jgi:hypothetical protein